MFLELFIRRFYVLPYLEEGMTYKIPAFEPPAMERPSSEQYASEGLGDWDIAERGGAVGLELASARVLREGLYGSVMGNDLHTLPDYDISTAARVAFTHFSHPDNKHVSSDDVRQRLDELVAVGYPARDYHSLNRGRLLRYFIFLRQSIREESDRSVPGFVQKILDHYPQR